MRRITYRDWRVGSDLTLALVKLGTGQRTAEEREFHLQHRVHLLSNRLGLSYLDEGSLYLRLAIGYFRNAGFANTPDGANVLWTLSHINDVITAAVERNEAI